MERLTTRNSEGIGVLKQPFACECCGDLQWSMPDLGNGEPIERLAEYEDTDLTPEQIREIDRLYAEKCKEIAEINKSYLTGLELANIAIEMHKLKKYKDLEKKGKLLKLPCAVGDMVYCIYNRYTKCSARNEEFEESSCLGCESECDSKKEYYVQEQKAYSLDWIVTQIVNKHFGKLVFLTREEAEAALEEQNQETV